MHWSCGSLSWAGLVLIFAVLSVASINLSFVEILVNHIPLFILVGYDDLWDPVLRAVVLDAQRCRAISCVEVLVEARLLASEVLGLCLCEHLGCGLILTDG